MNAGVEEFYFFMMLSANKNNKRGLTSGSHLETRIVVQG
jgi:hypothetical protein